MDHDMHGSLWWHGDALAQQSDAYLFSHELIRYFHRPINYNSGQGEVAGTCEYGKELSGSIKCGEFLDQLQNQLASQEGPCSME